MFLWSLGPYEVQAKLWIVGPREGWTWGSLLGFNVCVVFEPTIQRVQVPCEKESGLKDHICHGFRGLIFNHQVSGPSGLYHPIPSSLYTSISIIYT